MLQKIFKMYFLLLKIRHFKLRLRHWWCRHCTWQIQVWDYISCINTIYISNWTYLVVVTHQGWGTVSAILGTESVSLINGSKRYGSFMNWKTWILPEPRTMDHLWTKRILHECIMGGWTTTLSWLSINDQSNHTLMIKLITYHHWQKLVNKVNNPNLKVMI